ncbi:MAG TPA: YecA family protein [Albitalea sp.]
MSTPHRPRTPAPPPRHAAVQPLTEQELEELQALLDRVPAPLEPLDVSMLDGFLCGVLVQPQRIPPSRWLPHVTDADGRALPAGFDARRIHALATRRHAELDDSIERRQWFDPWVFELADVDDEASDDDAPSSVDAVFPWVAGFATAQEMFPALMRLDAQQLTEPLALLYRHLDAEDLEDADDLLEEIDTLEPPADLGEAVEGLVRATLLMADIGRPLPEPPKKRAPRARRPAQR